MPTVHTVIDFHTHNLQAPAGAAIINLPAAWTEHPALFIPRASALYSAGVHPWWTSDMAACERMLATLPTLLQHPQIIALGECGLDALRGGNLEVQEEVFKRQIAVAEKLKLPVTLHIVRTFDRLLRLKKELRPTTQWTVHGFRGRPALAQQLLAAGIDLSFGRIFNQASYNLTPANRRHEESDEDY